MDEYKDIAADALREIEKLIEALTAAERHFDAEAEMNAALHLSEKVMPNPLASKVSVGVRDGTIAHDRLRRRLMGEMEIPFEKEHAASGPDCWCGDDMNFHFISKGRVDRT